MNAHSGTVNISNGRLKYAGASGYDWSSVAAVYTNATISDAYYFGFDVDVVNPSRGPYDRWYGYPSAAWQTSYI